MAGFETDLTQCAGGSLVLGIIATAQLVGCGLVALTLFQAKDRCRHCCGFSPFWRRGTPLFFCSCVPGEHGALAANKQERDLGPHTY